MMTAAETAEGMSSLLGSLMTTFSSIFTTCWSMIEGNWFLLASVGIPLIAGIVFAVVSWFKGRG
ncbi:MAG: hypothetical protein UHM85_06010 [Acutalibacteraceae bacterium]|nr:hypothetical protein [Acutalibacteraceae bacterium]